MVDRRMARADVATGAVLFALSVALIYGSWTMDRLEIRQIHPLSIPGLLPGLLGIALAICSLLLVAQGARPIRRAEPAPGSAAPAPGASRGAMRRLVFAAFLCLGYALGLVGRLPFWLATSIFVAAFILAFEWSDTSSPRQRVSSIAWALGIGLCTGLSVAYAFSELFLVRLP